MNFGATISPQDVRQYANLPDEVPDPLLQKHIDLGFADLCAKTGRNTSPDGLEAIWDEAATIRALASVFPWLNTFALDGAAKVGRLEGAVNYKFLDATEVDERVKNLMGRFKELVAQIAPQEDGTETHISGMTLAAI